MSSLTFHEFLVDHAKFFFPEPSIGHTASSVDDLSEVEVGLVDNQWKALHAVRDNNLATKLCDALKTILGETPLTEPSRDSLLQWFRPNLHRAKDGWVDRRWEKNPNETHSKTLLELGVFSAIDDCLWRYDKSIKYERLVEQKVELAKSAVDFHVLVNDEIVTLLEAISPSVMNRLGESLPQNAFKLRWTAGSTSLVSRIFSKAALYLGLQQKEWLFLSCHNYWIVCRLVGGGGEPPFLAFSPLITMEDSSIPFRAFLAVILSVVKGGIVEDSVFDKSQELDIIEEEEEDESPPTPGDNDGSGGRSGQGPVGLGPLIRAPEATLMISSSSPLSPESFQMWIPLRPSKNIFNLPPIIKQRLWLTHFISRGSTSNVWKCHFDGFKEPFAVKIVEVLRSSDIAARKRFRNEVNIYIAMEKAYRSGKLQDRIAPRCYGAYKGENIDIFILDLHDTILDSWDHLKSQELLQVFKLVYDLHSLGIAHGDLEPQNFARTDGGKLLLIDFTESWMHRSKKCVAQNMTQLNWDYIPLKACNCNELNMIRELMIRRQPLEKYSGIAALSEL